MKKKPASKVQPVAPPPAEQQESEQWESLIGGSSYPLKDGIRYVARDYPLELLASIAAQLIRGVDPTTGAPTHLDYATAARDALALVAACDRLRDDHAVARREARSLILADAPASIPGTPIVRYREGLRFLTGETRTDRGEAKFREFIPKWKGTLPPGQVELILEHYRQEGFYQLPLKQMRALFKEAEEKGRIERNHIPGIPLPTEIILMAEKGIDSGFPSKGDKPKSIPAKPGKKPAKRKQKRDKHG